MQVCRDQLYQSCLTSRTCILVTKSCFQTAKSGADNHRRIISAMQVWQFVWIDPLQGVLHIPVRSQFLKMQRRKHVKYDAISQKMLMFYFIKLEEIGESKESLFLPEYFSSVFEGWNRDLTRFVGFLSCFPFYHVVSYSVHLLGVSSLVNQMDLDADTSIRFVTYVISAFKYFWSNMVCQKRNSCNEKRSIGNKVNLLLNGSTCEWIDFAIKAYLWTIKGSLKEFEISFWSSKCR